MTDLHMFSTVRMIMDYVTISQIARRWGVDRATARIALANACIAQSAFHASPRYPFFDILKFIENIPDELHSEVDVEECLLSASVVADRLGVTSQTVRNYGNSGRLHTVKLTDRTVRYMISPQICGSETETAGIRQK